MKNPNAVKLGKLGGLASAKSLTKEQRIARAKKAVQAREDKRLRLASLDNPKYSEKAEDINPK